MWHSSAKSVIMQRSKLVEERLRQEQIKRKYVIFVLLRILIMGNQHLQTASLKRQGYLQAVRCNSKYQTIWTQSVNVASRLKLRQCVLYIKQMMGKSISSTLSIHQGTQTLTTKYHEASQHVMELSKLQMQRKVQKHRHQQMCTFHQTMTWM